MGKGWRLVRSVEMTLRQRTYKNGNMRAKIARIESALVEAEAADGSEETRGIWRWSAGSFW